jgi:hypothetical protein
MFRFLRGKVAIPSNRVKDSYRDSALLGVAYPARQAVAIPSNRVKDSYTKAD